MAEANEGTPSNSDSQGHFPEIKKSHENESEIYMSDEEHGNLLHADPQGKNVNVFGSNALEVDAKGETLLHKACSLGDYRRAISLCEQYPMLKTVRDKFRRTPLFPCAETGNVELFKELTIKHGLSADRDCNMKNVLHVACEHGREKMVRYLVENHPSLISQTDTGGSMPLHISAVNGNVDIFKFLTQRQGCDILAVDINNQNVLHLACQHKRYELIHYIVTNHNLKGLMTANDNKGWTALHHSAYAGNVQIFQLLIQNGHNVNCLNNKGHSVLHTACSNGSKEIVKFILTNNPDLKDKCDKNKYNALHITAASDFVDVLDMLIQAGMDECNTSNNREDTILHIACRYAKYEMTKHLVKTYPYLMDMRDKKERNVLMASARGGNIRILELLLTKHKHINVRCLGTNGQSVLHEACGYGKTDIVKFLLENYPDLKKMTDNNGMTPLHYSAKYNKCDVFKCLVKHSSDSIVCLSKNQETVLHIAIQNQNYELAEYIASKYPNLRSKADADGRYPLHYCAKYGCLKLFRLLMDPNEFSKHGESVFQEALRANKKDIITYVLQNVPKFRNSVQEVDSQDITKYGKNATDERYSHPTERQDTQSTTQSTDRNFLPSEILSKEQTVTVTEADYRLRDINQESIKICVPKTVGLMEERSPIVPRQHAVKMGFRAGDHVPSLLLHKADFEIIEFDSVSRDKQAEVDSLCEHAKHSLNVEHVWAGRDLQSIQEELVLVALVNKTPEPSHDIEERNQGMRVLFRGLNEVSNEAERIMKIEKEQNLHFSPNESSKIHACLAKHSKRLMLKHRNIQILSASKFKSRRHGVVLEEKTCIIFYVHIKGILPYGEELFPETLEGFEVDVREGLFTPFVDQDEYHHELIMGCKIGNNYGKYATLGAFVDLGSEIGVLTAGHLFGKQARDVEHPYQVFQPDNSLSAYEFGKVIESVIDPGDKNCPGVDAALIEITDRNRHPVQGTFPPTLAKPLSLTGFSRESPLEFASGNIITSFEEIRKSCNIVKWGCITKQTLGVLRLSGSAVSRRSLQYEYMTHDNQSVSLELHQQIEIREVDDTRFSNSGDSGSLVFHVLDDGNAYEIRALGLVVGGTSYNTTMVTPIWSVLQKLNLPMKLKSFPPIQPIVPSSDQRISRLEEHMGGVKQELTEVKQELTKVEAKFDTKVTRLEEKIEQNTNEIRHVQESVGENAGRDLKEVKELLQLQNRNRCVLH